MSQTRSKQILVAPYWIEEIVKRNNLTLQDALDFEKIQPIASAADLAGALAIARETDYLVGQNMGLTDWNLYWSWTRSIRDEDKRAVLISTVDSLASDESFRTDAKDRLFSQDAKRQCDEVPFMYYDITPETGMFVIYPGFFTNVPNESLWLSFTEAVLKAMQVYMPHYQVAQTSWFNRYLQLLSNKQIAVAV